MPPVNGRFSSCSVYVIAWPVPKSLQRENICNLLKLLEKKDSQIVGTGIAQEINVELNSTKTKNLNEINMLDIGQKC
jgi:hypothetical protein